MGRLLIVVDLPRRSVLVAVGKRNAGRFYVGAVAKDRSGENPDPCTVKIVRPVRGSWSVRAGAAKAGTMVSGKGVGSCDWWPVQSLRWSKKRLAFV